MTRKLIPAAMLAFTLVACGGPDLTAYEGEAFAPCVLDQGAWAGERQTTRYVEDSFHDLQRSVGPFAEAVERTAREAANQPQADWPALFEPLHIEAGANIHRLGRLLPRMERAMDLVPMSSQMQQKQIWWPSGGHHTEYLRVAIAEEVVDHQLSAGQTAQFLTRLGEVEALLLELKSGGAPPESLARLEEAGRALADDWDAASTGFRRVIFDRPNMPVGESLGERVQARVSRICESYTTCMGEGDDCGSGGTSGGAGDSDSDSDGWASEPADGPPSR